MGLCIEAFSQDLPILKELSRQAYQDALLLFGKCNGNIPIFLQCLRERPVGGTSVIDMTRRLDQKVSLEVGRG
jgi:hypothetical protein